MNGNIAPTRMIALLALVMAIVDSGDAWAQRRENSPHLAYAFPAGFERGTACDIVVGGQHLKEVNEAYISGNGVRAEIIKWYRPMSPGEFNRLRMAMDEARQQLLAEGKKQPSYEQVATAAGISNEQLREMDIFQQRDRDPKRQPNEQLEEELTIRLLAEKDATVSKRELRLLTDGSVSNPVWIQIGQWPEACETEINDTIPDKAISRFPMVINGQIMPGDVDSFSFAAKRGTRLVILAAARDVIPYLADAVPGWFQAVLTLRDSAGAEVSFADSFEYRQDPVIYCDVPRDDNYTVQIRDSLYRGREDFVYRITIGEIPIVTSIFPLGTRSDSSSTIKLTGWNLSQTILETKPISSRQYRPVRWYSVPQDGNVSVQVPVQIDHQREVFDKEPNNDLASAQKVSPRTIINGRIDYPGDEDIFHISEGGRIAVEVRARRHGSPLDAVLTLTDEKGNELAFNDDYEDKGEGLLTHHADSRLVASVPATGGILRLRDVQGNGGADFVYRLYLRPPEHDFELRVTPATIIARAGSVSPITVHALREDGFSEDIELSLVNPPQGFQLSGGVIPGKADRVPLTLSVPPIPPAQPVILEMIGSTRHGRTSRVSLTRPAVPAENMMQAFIWNHLVPVEDWIVVVNGKPGPKPPFEILMTSPRVVLPRGGEVLLLVRPVAKDLAPDELRVELTEPKGISAELVTDAWGMSAVKLSAKADDTTLGERGNLLLYAYRETPLPPTDSDPKPKPRRTDYGFFPAIPFEISHRSR